MCYDATASQQWAYYKITPKCGSSASYFLKALLDMSTGKNDAVYQ